MSITVLALPDSQTLCEYSVPLHWATLTREQIAQHAPDMSLLATTNGQVVARCSLWWTSTPELDGQRIGAIGHYAAESDDAAASIMEAATAALQHRGCRMAVGPMDGNSWRSYRFVVDAGAEPPFFMEPTNPPSYPEQFATAGFAPLARYMSAVNSDLTVRDARTIELAERFAERGVTLRTLNMSDFEGEMRRVYAVSSVAFVHNFLYTPVSEYQFIAQYRAIQPLVMPELVTIAEHEGQTVGFCFVIPDLLELKRLGNAHTAILKTVAILPDRARYGGLGAFMIDRTHVVARELGFSRVIHALMQDSNQSRAISERTGNVMRRYTLFARPLAPATT